MVFFCFDCRGFRAHSISKTPIELFFSTGYVKHNRLILSGFCLKFGG